MNAPAPAELPPAPAAHFRDCVLAVAAHLIEQAALCFDSADSLLEQHPFLAGYLDEVPCSGGEGAAGIDPLSARGEGGPGHLPIAALRDAAALDRRALSLLLAIGLIEEDSRFAPLFDALQTAPLPLHRPTAGLLQAFFREPVDRGEVRAALRRLADLGLVRVINPDAPRLEQALEVPPLLWDALRGDAIESPAPWIRHVPADALPALDDLLLPDALRASLQRLPALLAAGEARAVVLRGPRHNGRRAALGALARALGRGLLEITAPARPDDERWRMIGPLATLLHAMPAITLDPAAGEAISIPALAGHDGPVGVALGRQGGVTGPGVDRAITFTTALPDPEARRAHWEAGLGGRPSPDLDDIADRFRMTSGHIRRAAAVARAHAALEGRAAVTIADARAARRALHREALDTLATRLDTAGTWDDLAVGEDTHRELRILEARCRHRERLGARVGGALRGQLNAGVRALFQGSSGTGKTLAARLLAASLGMDLYRVDLSAIVSKYIGETEKNLGQIFAVAEELDVILLFDEGDALLTQRTSVQTSNDRYANLETNYLLQRVESYEGILVVTTNAGELIDSAFQRRMDVVISFRPPEAEERHRLWELHLPGEHAVAPELLKDVSLRCALTGGQIRNVALHAALLALDGRAPLDAAHLEAALLREYRRMGAAYPLRRSAAAGRPRS